MYLDALPSYHDGNQVVGREGMLLCCDHSCRLNCGASMETKIKHKLRI